MAACPRLCTVGQFDIRFSSFKAMPPKGTAMPLNIMIVKKVSNLSIFYLHTPILHGKIYFNRSSLKVRCLNFGTQLALKNKQISYSVKTEPFQLLHYFQHQYAELIFPEFCPPETRMSLCKKVGFLKSFRYFLPMKLTPLMGRLFLR